MWLTFLRNGTIEMTQPTVIYFGPDGGERASPKVFLRTLLYSTAHKGQLAESLYVRLRCGESQQNFNIWVYGDDRLARGSGLFVGPDGIAVNHHFLLPHDEASWSFRAGDYVMEVYARLVGAKQEKCLTRIHLSVSDSNAEKLKDKNTGVYFDWGPDAQKYYVHVESRPIPTPRSLEALFMSSLMRADSEKPQLVEPGAA
jgi:hypothetical protein